jgi:predicted transcriptional regulator
MAGAGRNLNRHKHKTVSFRLPDQVMKQLRKLARRNRRTLSGEAQIAFENHLAANGRTASVLQPGAAKKA